MAYTSIGVSKNTKELLEILKKEHRVKTYDQLLVSMASKDKGVLLESIFGIAPRVGEFKRAKDEFERF